MTIAADRAASDAEVAEVERSACPTCGSCSGMFTANSMNCLTEALGLAFGVAIAIIVLATTFASRAFRDRMVRT